jgi:hypothetical protein
MTDTPTALSERDLLAGLQALLSLGEDRYKDLLRKWLTGDGWQVGSFVEFLAWAEEQLPDKGARA